MSLYLISNPVIYCYLFYVDDYQNPVTVTYNVLMLQQTILQTLQLTTMFLFFIFINCISCCISICLIYFLYTVQFMYHIQRTQPRIIYYILHSRRVYLSQQIFFYYTHLSLVRNEVSAKIYLDVAEQCVPPFRQIPKFAGGMVRKSFRTRLNTLRIT